MGNSFKRGMLTFSNELLTDKFTISTVPTIPVDLKEISDLPADIAQFGCAPSENAWGEKLDISAVNGLQHPWRYIGGHLWLSNSYDEYPWLAETEGIEKFIRALDYYLGLPFTYIFDRPEAYLRRKMYGRAGDYRTKQFSARSKGVEYRVLSPEWFNHTAWFSFVLGIARFLASRFYYIKHDAILERGSQIQAAINTGVGLEDLLPPRLFGFYTKEGLAACKEQKDRFMFQFLQCPDTHSGWDYWSTAWALAGNWDTGSSIDLPIAS